MKLSSNFQKISLMGTAQSSRSLFPFEAIAKDTLQNLSEEYLFLVALRSLLPFPAPSTKAKSISESLALRGDSDERENPEWCCTTGDHNLF